MKILESMVAPAVVAAMSVMSVSCSESDDNDDAQPAVDTELTVSGISATKWTYISLENNAVVGTSDKDDADSDARWAKRVDWDIAICGDLLRSNSGTSGCGSGGLRRIDGKDYSGVSATDAASVDEDRPQTPDEPRR